MNTSVTASTTGWNSVTSHYARTDIVDPQLIFGNFRVQAATGEVGNGGNIQTNTAAIEYPLGTRRQALNVSNGSTQLVLNELTYGYMGVTGLTIPKGALFRVRRYQVNTVGMFFSMSSERKINTSNGLDALVNNNIDQTMSGSPSGGGSIVAPQGIVSMTRAPSLLVLGSSRMTGTKDLTLDAGGDTGYARFYGPYLPYMDFSAAGDKTLSVAGAGGALRREIGAKHCSHLWIDPGLNDLLGGTTEANLMATINSLAASWSGGPSKVIVNDEAPDTTSTDGWTTTTGQSTIGIEGSRVLLNNDIAALSGFNQIIRPSIIAGTDTNNRYWVPNSTSDGLHENTSMLLTEVAAAQFNPALVIR
jgi:hypothetical protein